MGKGPGNFFFQQNHSTKRAGSGLRQEDRDMLAQRTDWNSIFFFFLALEEFDPLCVMS